MNETEKQTAANPDRAPIIEVNSMHKWYGDFHVLSDINLKVKLGERIVICGPSGSGKSTLIRCINRLEEHQRGQIIVNGTELTNDIKNIEKVRAEVGMVFQHFNLFPHLTILENLTLGPIWVRKTPKKDAEEMAMMYLEKVHIAEQALKFPGQLSGGQQQRYPPFIVPGTEIIFMFFWKYYPLMFAYVIWGMYLYEIFSTGKAPSRAPLPDEER